MAAPPPTTFPYDYLFKVLIIGDASVGKVSCFVAREAPRKGRFRTFRDRTWNKQQEGVVVRLLVAALTSIAHSIVSLSLLITVVYSAAIHGRQL